MSNARIERVRQALGADRVLPLQSGPARGPLDVLHQYRDVTLARDAEAERSGVIVLMTSPVVLAAASLRPARIEVVPSGPV